MCSLSNFRLARSRLYPLARVAAEESGAGLGWRDGGAGAELPGRSATRARSKLRRRAIGRVFALKFQAGEIASLSLGAGGSRGIWRGLGVA